MTLLEKKFKIIKEQRKELELLIELISEIEIKTIIFNSRFDAFQKHK